MFVDGIVRYDQAVYTQAVENNLIMQNWCV